MASPFNSKVENLPRHAYFGLITFGAELMNPEEEERAPPSVCPPSLLCRPFQSDKGCAGEDGKNRGDQAMLPRQRTAEREKVSERSHRNDAGSFD